jgi:hypothetical protein
MSTILFHVLSPNATVNQETTYSHSMSLHALATNLDSLTPLTPSGALNFYIPLCQHLLRRIQVIEKNRDPIELPTLQVVSLFDSLTSTPNCHYKDNRRHT